MSTRPRTRSIPTPTSDIPARALSALILAHGGTLTITTNDALNAPSHIDLTVTEGQWTFTAIPDEQRDGAATIWFPTPARVQLTNWTAETFGRDFVITGTLARSPHWPTVGDHVKVQRIELPGRGALENVTARVTITNNGPDITLTIGIDSTHLETR